MQSSQSWKVLSVFLLSLTYFTAQISPLISSAEAQGNSTPVMVFDNEYVVEMKIAAASASATGIKVAGVKQQRKIGTNTYVMGRNIAAASISSSEPKVVAYDPADTFCIDLIKRGVAETCSPNFEIKVSATPNDPEFPSLWGLSTDKGIDGPGAWDVSTGSNEVVVAIIDTGVDYNHPDLAQNIWTNPGEIAGNNIDDDGNGYVDDVHGMSAVNHSGNPFDDNGHGTHVAGTIGGKGNNSVGVAGVNWNVKIMALKFLNGSGSGSLAGAIEAINYMNLMKNRGVHIKVSNNSWGGGGYSEELFRAIRRANDAGIIFAAAAGNESNDNDANASYPASYDVANVVSVAAIDQDQNVAYFSNYGATSVDIAAPGVSIRSTYPNNRYANLSGTSMATPHVTGALALLLSNEPNLTVEQAISRLYDSAVDSGTLRGVVRTGRKLNVARMLRNETAPIPDPTPTPVPCTYSTEDIAYNPDTSADTQQIVVQADEYSFYQVSLPFSFPYFGQTVSSIYLSPNGLVYAGRVPSSMDYQNSEAAPINTIAALHTDLVADSGAYGVRVFADTDHVTVYWLVNHYSRRGEGDISVRLTIYASGVIEDYVSFANSDVETFVQARATVGISGANSSSKATYAHNSPLIRNNMAVRFVAQCDGNGGGGQAPLALSRIKVQGRQNERWSTGLVAGSRLRIDVEGTGSGATTLAASFDGRACPNTAAVSVVNGEADLKGYLPTGTGVFQRLTLSAPGGVSKSVQIRGGSRGAAKRKARRLGSARFNSYCDRLISSVTTRVKR